jgi:hypothetical protein
MLPTEGAAEHACNLSYRTGKTARPCLKETRDKQKGKEGERERERERETETERESEITEKKEFIPTISFFFFSAPLEPGSFTPRIFKHKKLISSWELVTHTCHPSYSGDRDQENHDWRPA